MTWEGIIPRKRRTTFEQFLGHDDPRIRSLAKEMLKQDMAERALLRADFKVEEAMLDPYLFTARFDEQVKDLDGETGNADDPHWLSEVPF
jgi:hypothetical protein